MKLKKEFSDFYSAIRIDSESQVLRQKREILENDIYAKLPDILAKHDISINKSDIRTIIQGSYKYNTTIKSDIVDCDIAVFIPLDTYKNNDPRKIKGFIRDAINIPSRTVTIKEPCITASYYEDNKEWLHIDLPLYAQDGNQIYLARGKEFSDNYSWENADPEGLNDYLCNQINGNYQLRRIICFIKKWKAEHYKNSVNDHEVPPSIGLTLLACECFCPASMDDDNDDLLSFRNTLKRIQDKFNVEYSPCSDSDIVNASISCYLPTTPYSDVFSKMEDSSDSYMITFYKRLSNAVSNLTNAVNLESAHDAGEYVQKVLGTDFTVPAKEAVASNILNKREHSFG